MITVQLVTGLALLIAAVAGDEYHRGGAEVGGAARNIDAAEYGAAHWDSEAQAALRERLDSHRDLNTARNVIMFLGDGMSVPTLAAARTLKGQREGRAGEDTRLYFETFPTAGLVKTYCVNAQIPDSACTATAYLCGAKTNQGLLGLTASVSRNDCPTSLDEANHVSSIAAWALKDGRDAGIVTTTRVTHASPAGAFARAANRNWESDADVRNAGYDPNVCPDIAHQLIHGYPGSQFKVILGGGRQEFRTTNTVDEEGETGQRTDGRDLITEWASDKAARNLSHTYVWSRQELIDVDYGSTDYLLGLFEGSHLQYHLEGDPITEPTLAELTEAAVRVLSRNPRGFFLFVEGGRIDHAHHDNYPHLALDETIEMDKAVERARQLTDPNDTLIVITADHAHVMAFNGYSDRGNDILGPSRERDDDGVPYMTLSYTNGPGFRSHVEGSRLDVTQDIDFSTLRWRTHVDVPLYSETHGGDDVAVFAAGPRHHVFSGLYEQSQLPHLMAYAACIGPGLHACDETDATSSALALFASPLGLAILLASTLNAL